MCWGTEEKSEYLEETGTNTGRIYKIHVDVFFGWIPTQDFSADPLCCPN